MDLQRKLIAELLGTLWLVLGGCGSAVLASNFMPDSNLGIGLLGVSLAFGLTVLVVPLACSRANRDNSPGSIGGQAGSGGAKSGDGSSSADAR